MNTEDEDITGSLQDGKRNLKPEQGCNFLVRKDKEIRKMEGKILTKRSKFALWKDLFF
jgi:hypothetical protein